MNPADTVQRQVLGLDARALLAQVCLRPVPQTSALLRAWVPPDAAELAPLFPRLEIMALQGRGGMGAVYKARQAGLEREVAIKILPPEAALDEAFAERFRAEARALAKLEHPNIVTVHESGQTTAGHLYFIMEYVDGCDLAHLLAEGALPWPQALAIARDVCAALQYAHACGIVHRDIKPANVLLRKDGAVKVVDFGLSCLAARTPEETSRLTEAGSGLGTPVYMAPEQRAGSPVDGRADIYSLGVMVYEMLTRELPQGTWCPPSRRSRCSRTFDAAISRAMQPHPAHRISSAADFGRLIENELSGRNSSLRRRRLLLLGGSTAALAAASWGWRHFPRSAPGSSGPAMQQFISAPGTHELLSGLDLSQAVISGEWLWLEGNRERILTVSYTPERPTSKILHLPVAPGADAYELRAELQFDSVGSDITIVFPAGQTRAALVLDLRGYSGFEAIAGADWKSNSTTLQRRLPVARFLPLTLTVQPEEARIRLSVLLDDQPFMQWEGPQSSLTLPEQHYPEALMPQNKLVPVLLSRKGGMRLRELVVKLGL